MSKRRGPRLMCRIFGHVWGWITLCGQYEDLDIIGCTRCGCAAPPTVLAQVQK